LVEEMEQGRKGSCREGGAKCREGGVAARNPRKRSCSKAIAVVVVCLEGSTREKESRWTKKIR
jgi:hypothetical protein